MVVGLQLVLMVGLEGARGEVGSQPPRNRVEKVAQRHNNNNNVKKANKSRGKILGTVPVPTVSRS